MHSVTRSPHSSRGHRVRELVVGYRSLQHHALLSADPVLVGLNTLQQWLWQRLQAALSSKVAA